MNNETHYTPGVCNINQPEVAYRRKAGHIMMAVSLVLLAAFVFLGVPAALAAVVLFVTGMLTAVSYLQAKNKFCVAYAAQGVYNSSDKYADTNAVVDSVNKKIDKDRANKIYRQSALIGLVIAAVTFALLSII